MTYLEFIIEIIHYTAWPISVLIIAILFRMEIGKVIRRISKLKYKDAEATFEKDLQIIESQVEKIKPLHQEEAGKLPEPPATETKEEQLKRIAELSPRAAIVETWRQIEEAVYAVAKKHNINTTEQPAQKSFDQTVRSLISKGIISVETIEIFDSLRKLRNQAVHSSDTEFEVDVEEVKRFVEITQDLIRFLWDISQN